MNSELMTDIREQEPGTQWRPHNDGLGPGSSNDPGTMPKSSCELFEGGAGI